MASPFAVVVVSFGSRLRAIQLHSISRGFTAGGTGGGRICAAWHVGLPRERNVMTDAPDPEVDDLPDEPEPEPEPEPSQDPGGPAA
jgi:hypothetical protein